MLWRMPRQPEKPPVPEEQPLTEEDLKNIRQGLSRLHVSLVQDQYREVHRHCEMIGDKLPSPKAIQHLVQIYQCLWKGRKRRR